MRQQSWLIYQIISKLQYLSSPCVRVSAEVIASLARSDKDEISSVLQEMLFLLRTA